MEILRVRQVGPESSPPDVPEKPTVSAQQLSETSQLDFSHDLSEDFKAADR